MTTYYKILMFSIYTKLFNIAIQNLCSSTTTYGLFTFHKLNKIQIKVRISTAS